jgi:hypothetical protein
VSSEPASKEEVKPRPETFYPPPPPTPEPAPIKKKLKKLRPETFIPTAWAVKNYE